MDYEEQTDHDDGVSVQIIDDVVCVILSLILVAAIVIFFALKKTREMLWRGK